MVTLRNYQNKQLDFLTQQKDSNIMGLQSPTGSGKSFVIFDYVKEYLKDKHGVTVTIATGFNNLIWQLFKDSKLFDLDCTIILGASYLVPTCGTSETGFQFKNYSVNKCNNCPYISYKTQGNQIVTIDERPENCAKKSIYNYLIDKSDNKIIITNHSYFLLMQEIINTDLLIIDEAHAMNEFYTEFNIIKLSPITKQILNNYVKQINTPYSFILKQSLKNNQKINSTVLAEILDEIIRSNLIVSQPQKETVQKELIELFLDEKTFESYIGLNDNNEIVKYKFFCKYNLIAKNILITSATLDDYTLKMFNLTNRNQIYKQPEPLDRYVNSHYVEVLKSYKDGFNEIYDLIKDKNKGLILCTTIENVNWTIDKLKQLKDFKVCTKINEITNDKCILVGSKAYFQGIDIQDLDFVILDKIPFQVYDNKFKAYSYYLKETIPKCDPWSDYTLPLVKNVILQASGRLWRKNNYETKEYDNGMFILCDERLKGRFKYLSDYFVNSKKGIQKITIK